MTKELNDLLVYDFKTQRLSVLNSNGDPSLDPSRQDDASRLQQLDASPKNGKTVSPLRKGVTGVSPARKSNAVG